MLIRFLTIGLGLRGVRRLAVRVYRLPGQCASFLLRFSFCCFSSLGFISYISVMIDTILFLFLLLVGFVRYNSHTFRTFQP